MMRANLPVVFIVITLALDAIGFGLIMPVMPDLLRQVTGGDLSRAALWAGVLMGGFAMMQFLFGPVLGNLSDRFGRKPVLLLSLAVLAIDYTLLALAGTIWLVLAARLATGAASSTFGTAAAWLADISTPEQKAARFGLIGAAFGIGFVIGPALGGLLGEFGTRAPFVAAAALATANLLFGLLVLRETLPAERRRPFQWRRANPFGAFRHIGRMPGLAPWLGAYFLHELAFAVYPVIWAYFVIARFDLTVGQVGASLAAFGLGFAVVQGGLIRPVMRWLGRWWAMVLGTVCATAALIGLVIVQDIGWLIVLIPLSSLGGLVVPGLRAELSDRVSADQQGELQGAMGSLRAVGMMAAPFLYTTTFAAFTGPDVAQPLPGAAFAVAAAMNLAILALLWRARGSVTAR